MDMTAHGRQSAESLAGKTIDAHTHIGVSLKQYAALEYPYAQTAEGLHYRLLANNLDAACVFPFGPDLHFDLPALLRGQARESASPVSPFPYAIENELLMREVYEYCPELSHRFIPFLCADPSRATQRQVEALGELAHRHPVYGIKILPVYCQSRITALLDEGRAILDFAEEHGLPLLLHTTADEREPYSHASLTFRVVRENPQLRFCLAHCIGFDRRHLDQAAELGNVWFDTSALTIQCRLAVDNSPVVASEASRFPSDYRDPRRVLCDLVQAYPDTILWGTDSPCYAYICRRAQADGVQECFRLKATYEEEVAALRSLDAAGIQRTANRNTVKFLFGTEG